LGGKGNSTATAGWDRAVGHNSRTGARSGGGASEVPGDGGKEGGGGGWGSVASAAGVIGPTAGRRRRRSGGKRQPVSATEAGPSILFPFDFKPKRANKGIGPPPYRKTEMILIFQRSKTKEKNSTHMATRRPARGSSQLLRAGEG